MIITQTFTSARWQIVVRKSKPTKQNKDQNSNLKTAAAAAAAANKNKTGGVAGVLVLTPSCRLRRGPGGDRDPRTWGKSKSTPSYAVTTRMAPAFRWTAVRTVFVFVLFFDESRFNVSLTARDKVTRQCTHATIAEETKAEAESNRVPSAYQPEFFFFFFFFLFFNR